MDINTFIGIIIGVFFLIIILSYNYQMRNQISQMKSTLDKIAKQVGVPDIVTDNLKSELLNLISKGKKYKAIKKFRVVTGLGLKESEDYINQLTKKENK
jgi:ribosomal protein L7/L12